MKFKHLLWTGITTSLLAACGQQATNQPAGTHLAAQSSTGTTLSAQSATTSSTGRYIMVFRGNTVPGDLDARVSKAGGKLQRTLGPVGVATFTGTPATAKALARGSDVQAVGTENYYTLPELETADITVTDATAEDSAFGEQWDMRRIHAPQAAAFVGAERQAQVMVGVLDTGVMTDHPDLEGRVLANIATNYCREPGDPTSGYPVYTRLIDFDRPIDMNNLCTDAPSTMYQAHGTHVAGTIGAKIGGGSIVGVAPDVKIVGYKVFDRIRFTTPYGIVDRVAGFDGPILNAVLHAAQNGVSVINMSLGGTLDRSDSDDNATWIAWSRVMDYANRQGTLTVASAGNAAQSSNGTIAHIPSDISSIMSVSATGVASFEGGADADTLNASPNSDVLAFYSNYGASTDIAAPGGDCGINAANGLSWCDRASGNRAIRNTAYPNWFRHLIYSTVINADGTPGYAYYAGTSMASPHVAGVAALVKAAHPRFSPNQLRARLGNTADKVGQKQEFGAGLVNALEAVK